MSVSKYLKFIRKMLPVPINRRILPAIGTFASNILRTRIFNSQAKRGPLFLTWLVTFRCNCSCIFCSTHQFNERYPEQLELNRALEIAHQIGRAKTWVVGFTGGEVLLWPHLFEVIKVLKSYQVMVYVVSNGLLLEDYAEQLIKIGVDYIIVSLDSIDPETHDQQRNCPGLYEKALRGLKLISKHRDPTTKKPTLKTTTIINRQNLEQLETTIEKLKQYVDVVSLQPIVAEPGNSPHIPSKKCSDSLFFKSSEEALVKSRFNEILNNYPEFNTPYFRKIPDFWFHPSKLMKQNPCWSPFLRLSIMPNGDAFHCVSCDAFEAVGNVNEQSLLEVWNSSKMKQQREQIRRCQNKCICWTQSTSFNALLNSIPLFKHLPKWGSKPENVEKLG